MPTSDADLDAKIPRGIDAWFVSVELFMCIHLTLFSNKFQPFIILSTTRVEILKKYVRMIIER